MKSTIKLGILLLIGTTGNAFAANCTGDNSALQHNAEAVLGGQRITAVGSGDDWEEDHCTNGTLYKVGTTESPPKYPGADSVDPRRPIGSWSPAGDNITYDYGSGGSYTFELWQTNCTGATPDTCSGTYYFCNGSSEVARITNGPSPIPDSCS